MSRQLRTVIALLAIMLVSGCTETKTESVTQVVEFKTDTRIDPSLRLGERAIGQQGEEGMRTLSYEVTVADGKEQRRKLIDRSITKAPKNKVILVGSRPIWLGELDREELLEAEGLKLDLAIGAAAFGAGLSDYYSGVGQIAYDPQGKFRELYFFMYEEKLVRSPIAVEGFNAFLSGYNDGWRDAKEQ